MPVTAASSPAPPHLAGVSVSDTEYDQAYPANAIFDAHRDDPEFGYRLLFDQVHAAGHQVSERTV